MDQETRIQRKRLTRAEFDCHMDEAWDAYSKMTDNEAQFFDALSWLSGMEHGVTELRRVKAGVFNSLVVDLVMMLGCGVIGFVIGRSM